MNRYFSSFQKSRGGGGRSPQKNSKGGGGHVPPVPPGSPPMPPTHKRNVVIPPLQKRSATPANAPHYVRSTGKGEGVGLVHFLARQPCKPHSGGGGGLAILSYPCPKPRLANPISG